MKPLGQVIVDAFGPSKHAYRGAFGDWRSHTHGHTAKQERRARRKAQRAARKAGR